MRFLIFVLALSTMFNGSKSLAQSQSSLKDAYQFRNANISYQDSITKINKQLISIYARLSEMGLTSNPVNLDEVFLKDEAFVNPAEIYISTREGKVCRVMVTNRLTLAFDGCK